MNVMTKLIKGIDDLKSPIVAGMDTTEEMLPKFMKDKYLEMYGRNAIAVSKMLIEYNKIIIDNIYDLVPAVKIQIAMYEKYGVSGIRAYIETASYAAKKGLLVIGDIKRGDIGSTATAYAAHLTGAEVDGIAVPTWNEDMITVNPYLGEDSLMPFVNVCKKTDKACFVLVKTSNPGSKDIQDLISKEYNEPIYESVGKMVENLGRDTVDNYGYSAIGAVVGATHREIGGRLRKIMPNTFFLVPGYGAQGAGAEDIKGFFDKDGRGSIVNSSRGIIANWQKHDKYSEQNIGSAARDAVLLMKKDLGGIIGE